MYPSGLSLLSLLVTLKLYGHLTAFAANGSHHLVNLNLRDIRNRLCFFIFMQVSAKLKLVRLELIDTLIHNTLEHDNLVSLCFAPMLKNAWNLSLIREINASASSTLRNLTVNFRSVQALMKGCKGR